MANKTLTTLIGKPELEYLGTEPDPAHKGLGIESLPNSILENIFHLCLPDILIFSGPPWHRIVIFTLWGNTDHTTILRLMIMHVNRRWRSIVLSTPTLWSTLVMDPGFTGCQFLLEMNFKYSGDQPLDVIVRPQLTFRTRKKADNLFKLLRTHRHRIHVFAANFMNYSELLTLFPVEPGKVTEMPRLKIFMLQAFTSLARYNDTGDLENSPMGNIYAPNLDHLQLGDSILLPCFLTTCFLPIRTLLIDSAEGFMVAPTYTYFLACCPNVETISMIHFPQINPPGAWPHIRLKLPRLRNFSFLSQPSFDMLYFLRSLHMPAVRCLRFNRLGRLDESYLLQVFWYLMTETVFTLEDLVLDSYSMPKQIGIVEPLVNNLHNLQILELHNVEISKLLETLIPQEGKPCSQWPCPRLRSLILREVDLFGDELRHFVDSRCYQMEPEMKQLNMANSFYYEDRVWPYNRVQWELEWVVRNPSKIYINEEDWKNGRRCTVGVFRCSILQDETFAAILQLVKSHKGFKYVPASGALRLL